jgi:hypothetical protein
MARDAASRCTGVREVGHVSGATGIRRTGCARIARLQRGDTDLE